MNYYPIIGMILLTISTILLAKDRASIAGTISLFVLLAFGYYLPNISFLKTFGGYDKVSFILCLSCAALLAMYLEDHSVSNILWGIICATISLFIIGQYTSFGIIGIQLMQACTQIFLSIPLLFIALMVVLII